MTYIVYNDFSVCSPTVISEEGFCSLDEPIESFEADSFREIYSELMLHKPEGKIPAIVCHPLKEAALTFITPCLHSFQQAVGGNIEIVSHPDLPGVDIICNEDGKINKMRLNRGLFYKNKLYDVIAGSMVIVGVNAEGESIGLNEKIMEKVYYRFKEPEVFIIDREAQNIKSVKCSAQTAEIMRENNISIIG